jgi:flagellar motor switch protein FliN/FliY
MKMGSVQQVRVPVQVVLGRTEISLEDLSRIDIGSIIELKSLAGEPVEFVVSGEIVALGEVVVIDESFGIRLTELVDTGRQP